jgi:hypothetical protein
VSACAPMRLTSDGSTWPLATDPAYRTWPTGRRCARRAGARDGSGTRTESSPQSSTSPVSDGRPRATCLLTSCGPQAPTSAATSGTPPCQGHLRSGRPGTAPARTVGSSQCEKYARWPGRTDHEHSRATGRRAKRPRGRYDRVRRLGVALARAGRSIRWSTAMLRRRSRWLSTTDTRVWMRLR